MNKKPEVYKDQIIDSLGRADNCAKAQQVTVHVLSGSEKAQENVIRQAEYIIGFTENCWCYPLQILSIPIL